MFCFKNGYSGTRCELEPGSGELLGEECNQLEDCKPCSGDCRVPDFTGDSFLVLPLQVRFIPIPFIAGQIYS